MVNWQKSCQLLGVIAIAFSPALVGFSSPLSVRSTANKPQSISLQFPAARDRGAPKTTSGGGTRSDVASCISVKEGEPSLTALMPSNNNIGTTASATPTLYWYIPTTKATSGEIVITDESNQEIYQASFALKSSPGIVKFTIPAQASLKPDKQYGWSFMIVCDRQYRNRDVAVAGDLKYQGLDADIRKELASKTLLEQAKIYAKNAIWLETLDTAAQLRPEQPAAWEELLQSVGLSAIAKAPFTDCCTADK